MIDEDEYDGLYDDPNLLDDSDYVTARCGLPIHVDDVEFHDDHPEQCEMCLEMDGA